MEKIYTMYTMYDLIIIGGGPGGVAAGIYASRKKMNALLITKDFGGQSVTSAKIENFIGHLSITGLDLSKTLEAQLRAHRAPDHALRALDLVHLPEVGAREYDQVRMDLLAPRTQLGLEAGEVRNARGFALVLVRRARRPAARAEGRITRHAGRVPSFDRAVKGALALPPPYGKI